MRLNRPLGICPLGICPLTLPSPPMGERDSKSKVVLDPQTVGDCGSLSPVAGERGG
jgi:hypothetical protein